MKLRKLAEKFKKMNSVFQRLIISYVIVVIIVTFILGIFSYLFFSSRFNQEVKKVHQHALEQVSDTLKFRIIEPVIMSFIDLSAAYIGNTANIFHFNNPLKGNHYKLYQTYEYLQKIVSDHSGVISAVHVYYKKQGLVISSSSGISYLNNKNQSYKGLDWIALINSLPDNFRRIESEEMMLFNITKKNKGGKANLFTFLKTYPLISSITDYQGIMAIDVAEDTVSNIIRDAIPSQYRNIFLINNHGEIISHPQKEFLSRKLGQEKYMERILASPKNCPTARLASSLAP